MINSAKPNHPRIMAAVPTPLFTLPLPKSWAIVLAPTDAVCCHKTETSTKTEATKMSARATWETGREGNGLTSRSEPSSSRSSCQPGNVARRRKQTNARTMATILKSDVSKLFADKTTREQHLHQIRKHNTVLESIGHPYQIQGILVHGHLCRQTRGIVTAQKRSTVRIDAYAKVANTDFELRLSDDVSNCRCDAGVNL